MLNQEIEKTFVDIKEVNMQMIHPKKKLRAKKIY